MYVTHRENMIFTVGRKVRQLSVAGKTVAEYNSISEAFEATGAPGIHKAAKGKYKTSGGFKWEYI